MEEVKNVSQANCELQNQLAEYEALYTALS
jgi:hypothetical protein